LGWDTDRNTKTPKYTKGTAWEEVITENQFDYTYYAIFRIHAFNIIYKNYDDSEIESF